jgi:hypothetical protein
VLTNLHGAVALREKPSPVVAAGTSSQAKSYAPPVLSCEGRAQPTSRSAFTPCRFGAVFATKLAESRLSHSLITEPSSSRKLSLLTRLLGFGGCLLGAFAIGYYQGIQSVVGTINNEVFHVLGTTPNFAQAVAPAMTKYIQQNVTPTVNDYLLVGIVLAAGGIILVARGDRKPKSDKQEVPLPPQPVPVKQ